jgi:hypothetical protein
LQTRLCWEPSWTPPPPTGALDVKRSGGNSSKHSSPLPRSLGGARCPLFLPPLPVSRVLLSDGEELPPKLAGPVGAVDGFAPEMSMAAVVEVLPRPALEPGNHACSAFYCSRPGDIGASDWLVRQLRFGLQLPRRRVPPRSARITSYNLSPADQEFACGEVRRWMMASFCRRASDADI